MTGPSWTIPMELVRVAANADGQAQTVAHALRHVHFKPHAVVERTPNGFVARVSYFDPRRPGRDNDFAVLLTAMPQENAA